MRRPCERAGPALEKVGLDSVAFWRLAEVLREMLGKGGVCLLAAAANRWGMPLDGFREAFPREVLTFSVLTTSYSVVRFITISETVRKLRKSRANTE